MTKTSSDKGRMMIRKSAGHHSHSLHSVVAGVGTGAVVAERYSRAHSVFGRDAVAC